MFSSLAAASVFLIASSVLANPLATITPCVGCPESISVPPVTVVSQYQTVSTCAPTTSCLKRGLCKTAYPFETFAYVSTVIPVPGGSATITKTNQPVTVSRYRSTVTSFRTPAGRHARPTPVYSTIGRDFVVPYNKIGPLAIPGYGGSGLCKDCGKDGSGVFHQPVGVTECTAGPQGTKCSRFIHTIVSASAPSAVSQTAAACSTSFTAASAGTYTFTFPHTAPARTITAHGHTFTVDPKSFNVYASRFFPHAGPFNFRTTITTTVTQTVPPRTQSATATHSVAVPPYWNHNPWTKSSVSTSKSADPSPWLDWTTSSHSTPTTSTSTWGPSSTSVTTTGSPTTTTATTFSFPTTTTTATSTSTTSTSTSTSTTTTTSIPTTTPSTTTTTTTTFTIPTTTPSTTTTTTTTPTTTITTTPTTTTTTTTTSTTTITSAPVLSDIPSDVKPIYITVNVANARYRKRAIDYVSFGSGGDAVLVSDIASASSFDLYEGYLIDIANGEYVGTDASSGTPALEEFADAASASNNWASTGGVLSFSDVTFCYNADHALFMVFPGATTPAGCITCVLGSAQVSSTTTTTTTSTTTTSAPQTSDTLTERELESQEKEVEQLEVVDKRTIQKRHGFLHNH